MDTEPPECRDDELILLIQKKDANPATADAAWLELYRRHSEFVFRCLQRSRRLIGKGFDEDDVVERTFTHVYLKAASSFKPGEYSSTDDARRHVRRWLNQIAQFQLLNLIALRDCAILMPRDPSAWRLASLEARQDHFADNDAESERVRQIVASVLDPLDLQIIWFKLQHYDPITGVAAPPADELAAFCETHEITKELIRKRYERALAKVEEALRAAQSTTSY
jgi:DNA-directed RNA polymerase specialized sigma24 family protein